MIKINTVKHDKLWGYEIWLHSPLEGMETTDEFGNKTYSGPLVKILKADMPLSVQVHPDDHFAKLLENESNGKSESWYILKAKSDSQLVVGIKTLDEEKIKYALKNKIFFELLKWVIPKPGEFYNIPAGLVHGVGAGMEILEVQQPSDVTYRYYDYDRQDDQGNTRELHVDKAIKVQKDLDYHLEPLSKNPLTYKNATTTQEFYKEHTVIKQESIIVDLDTYDCYIAKPGEKINFKNYAVILK